MIYILYGSFRLLASVLLFSSICSIFHVKVEALWDISNEPRFPAGGEGWPTALETDYACRHIFATWLSRRVQPHLVHRGRFLQPIFSGLAEIDSVYPQLIKFMCFDNRDQETIVESGEAFHQGFFWMLCPPNTTAELYDDVEVDQGAGVTRDFKKGKCITSADRPEEVHSGLAACREFVSKATGYSQLKATLSRRITHPFNTNTADARSRLVSVTDSSEVYISVTPLYGGRAIKEPELQ